MSDIAIQQPLSQRDRLEAQLRHLVGDLKEYTIGVEVRVGEKKGMRSRPESIGGLCDAWFSITRFVESQSGDLTVPRLRHSHLASVVRPFFAMFSQRSRQPRKSSYE